MTPTRPGPAAPRPAAYRLVRAAVPAPTPPALDERQRQVVDHAGGPLLVLAGPGTGKTTTLVEAVVARIERGLRPDQVLVLTFSRKAADELRERITARLGRTVAEPAAYTFHSWCFGLVRAFADPGAPPPRLLSGPERDVRIRELLHGNADGEGVTCWPASVRPALKMRGFAREVGSLVDRARERGLDGTALRELGERTGRAEWAAAGTFLDEYLAVLDARGELDYAGLVSTATDLLQRPEVAAEMRFRFGAVFVDEYQDTDPAQERLLQIVAGSGRDLVVVGDPDQSIYAFRGADVSNILEFRERFRHADGRPADVVTLSTSRRAGADLLAVSRAVAARLPTPGLPVADRLAHRSLSACGPKSLAEPEIRLHATVAEEVTGIADLLRRAHLELELPWSQMAVLVRSGVRSIPVLRRALTAAGVPVSVAADEVPVAQDPAVAPLIAALRLADEGPASLTADGARLLLLSPLGGALPSGLRVLGRRLRALERAAGAAFPRPSAQLIREVVVDPAELVAVDDWVATPVRRLHATVAQARGVLQDGGTPEQALWVLWDGSGWARRLAAQSAAGGAAGRNADRDLDAVIALFEAAARLEERQPRAGVGTLLDELGMQEIPAAPDEERAGAPDAVRLMTAHRSKGLEWDVVVVSGVQDGVWPDLRRRTSFLDADAVDRVGVRQPASLSAMLVDERRLFYVAVTRARRRLVLTAVSSVDEAGDRPSRLLEETGLELPATRLSGTDLLAPSSLVARLRRAVQDPDTSPAMRAAAARQLAELADARADDGSPLVPVADPAGWWGTREWTPGAAPLRDPEQPVVLSASGVAAYDACPLRWFLEREARARGESSAAQGFGTAVHAIVQLVAEGLLPPDADVLMEQLDAVWGSIAFEAPWQRERERQEARGAVRRFLVWMLSSQRKVVGTEAEFTVQVGDVVLRGSADRVEVDDAGRVHVVDFKTGRTPKRGDDLPQEPQLGVYQVAAREGAFADLTGSGQLAGQLGGAELVWLRQERKGGVPLVQPQPALPDDGPTWADELLARTSKGVRGEEFPARPTGGCGSCAFHGSCPAQDAGRQVVE